MGGDTSTSADCHEDSAKSTTSNKAKAYEVLTGIKHPGRNDVRFGRGGRTSYHFGNSQFRVHADDYRERYHHTASRREKTEIAQELVSSWKSKDPPGRFLALTDPSDEDNSLWYDVGTEQAIRKAKKVLGEKQMERDRRAMTDPSGEDSLLYHDVGTAKGLEKGKPILNERDMARKRKAEPNMIVSSNTQKQVPRLVHQVLQRVPRQANQHQPQPPTENPWLQPIGKPPRPAPEKRMANDITHKLEEIEESGRVSGTPAAVQTTGRQVCFNAKRGIFGIHPHPKPDVSLSFDKSIGASPKDNSRGDEGHRQEVQSRMQGQGDNDGDSDFMGMEGLESGFGESFPTAASLTSVFNSSSASNADSDTPSDVNDNLGMKSNF